MKCEIECQNRCQIECQIKCRNICQNLSQSQIQLVWITRRKTNWATSNWPPGSASKSKTCIEQTIFMILSILCVYIHIYIYTYICLSFRLAAASTYSQLIYHSDSPAGGDDATRVAWQLHAVIFLVIFPSPRCSMYGIFTYKTGIFLG